MVRTSNNYTQILKYISLFGSVQGLGIIVNLIRNKLVALLLGPHGMGILSLFSYSIKLIGDTTNLGLGTSAVRELTDHDESAAAQEQTARVRVIRSWVMITALAGTLLFAAASPLLSRWSFREEGDAWQFVLLSPLVGLTALIGGETAILKGTRQLGKLARLSVFNILTALIISVPLFYLYGTGGIVPSLLLVGVAQALATVYYSYRLFPPRFSFSTTSLHPGIGMVRLGTAFVLAGAMGSGAEYIVRTYLNNVSGTETVGLYNAGYMLAVTYASLVFAAMETDYFPRISALLAEGKPFSAVVNRQIEISLLLITPLLIMLILGMPIILPLLFSGKFMSVLPMVQISALSMLCRAIYLPLEYITLAKGDSKSYCILETVNDLMMVACVIIGYSAGGLKGVGAGLLAASAAECAVSFLYVRYRYGLIGSLSLTKIVLVQTALAAIAYAITSIHDLTGYLTASILITAVSLTLSLLTIGRKTKSLHLPNRWNRH